MSNIRIIILPKITKLFLILTISVGLISSEINASAAESYPSTCIYQYFLSSSQLSVYNQVCSAASNYDMGRIKMDSPLTESELEIVMISFYNDHPEYFWVNTYYKYGINSQGMCSIVQLTYGISQENFAESQTIYNNMVSNIVTAASAYPTTVEKERYIHDVICQLATYNPESTLNQSAYSVLSSGESVCAGYSRAFQDICTKAGIPCYYVTGISKGQSHAWNIVNIDGRYLNVDLTWDDSISEKTGTNSYTYFNQPDSIFNKDHIRTGQSIYLIACE